MAAISSASFLQSIGVNTHLDYSGAYANTAQVISEINYLGVKNIRDALSSPYDIPVFKSVAAATGAKFDIYLSTGQTIATQISQMAANTAILRFAEGVNEPDVSTITYDNGLSGVAGAAVAQQALYDAITAVSTVGVIGPAYGNVATYSTAPATTNNATYGNLHEYWGTGNQPISGLSTLLGYANSTAAGKPIISTEAGYYTGPSLTSAPVPYNSSGVSETVQAKYTLTALFENWNAGVQVTYLYQLLDNISDPNNTNPEEHYGLYNANGTAKAAATAIHNLTTILGDTGPARSGDAFGYQVVGAPITAGSLLMEKSTGVFDVAVWNDVQLWNGSYSPVAAPVVPVTLNFGQLVMSVTEYDPLSGTTAVASWSNVSSIALTLPDHPVIFEVRTYPAGQLSLANYALPLSLSGGQGSGNIWSQVMANIIETNPNWVSGETITSISTTGTAGTVSFNAAAQSLIYTAPAYNGLNPNDSFTYTVSDGHGGTATGTVAITELPAPNTTYAVVAGASYTAPSSNWTMTSLAAGQSFGGSPGGYDTFNVFMDTKVYGAGDGNVFVGGNGSFYIGAGANNARVTLGDGNSTIAVSGTGAVITTGNGNNLVWRPTGSATITMGNGNQQITALGSNNTVTIGSGTSAISLGADNVGAGRESVTVGGGTNSIVVGGTNDFVHILGGTGNTVVSNGGLATVVVEGGSNTLNLTGAGNTITLRGGTNTSNSNGANTVITGGTGADTIWAAGNYNVITAGTGVESITTTGQYNTVRLTQGTDTFIENGSLNTIVLAAAGGTAAQIKGNVIALGDKLDLTTALAATTWNGDTATLSNYLSVRNYGSASFISIDADGTEAGAKKDIAVLNNSGNLTYQGLLAQAILPPTTSQALSLTQPSIPQSLYGGQGTGNIWSQILANVIEPNASWVSNLTVTAVGTTGTTGTVVFNATTKTLSYTAPAYNPTNPSDSFTYTVSDGHSTVSGTVAVTELPAANTTYATTAGTTYTAPSAGWTMISLATGQSLRGAAAGLDTFVLSTDTKVYAAGDGNVVRGGNGNFYVGAGANNARVTLGDGNSTIAVTGSGAVITSGNGNLTVSKPTGSATVTTGNGNQTITATGAGNVVSVGVGTSQISLGADGVNAGNESVTVAGGSGNVITVGGARDSVHLLGGTGNIVLSKGGQSTITVDGGSNTVTAQAGGNTVTLVAGTNMVNGSGNGNTIIGGTGTDTISAAGDYSVVKAGTGIQFITTTGHNGVFDLTHGTDTFTDGGSGNTIILAAAGGTVAQIKGNVIALNDVFDLRTALAATSWGGSSTDLSSYLSVHASASGASVISIDADGPGSGAIRDIAVLNNSAYLSYQGLLAHSIVS